MLSFGKKSVCIATVLAFGLFVATSQAGMLIDVRANTGSGTGAYSVLGEKSVEVSGNGVGTFNADVWVQVTGAASNAGLDGFMSFVGGFWSNNTNGGTARGNLAMNWIVPTGGLSAAGGTGDMDGDGDFDIGPTGPTLPAPTDAGWPTIKTTSVWNSSTIPAGTAVHALADGGYEFKIGTLTFNGASAVSAPAADAVTNLNFKSADRVTGLTYGGVARLDGSASNTNYATLPSGSPVVIAAPVPEPSTLALMGMMLLGVVVWFRRR
jgi:hypothetical protein